VSLSGKKEKTNLFFREVVHAICAAGQIAGNGFD
jgi:hypothetical protein